jgi:hypothetical protein
VAPDCRAHAPDRQPESNLTLLFAWAFHYPPPSPHPATSRSSRPSLVHSQTRSRSWRGVCVVRAARSGSARAASFPFALSLRVAIHTAPHRTVPSASSHLHCAGTLTQLTGPRISQRARPAVLPRPMRVAPPAASAWMPASSSRVNLSPRRLPTRSGHRPFDELHQAWRRRTAKRSRRRIRPQSRCAGGSRAVSCCTNGAVLRRGGAFQYCAWSTGCIPGRGVIATVHRTHLLRGTPRIYTRPLSCFAYHGAFFNRVRREPR